MSRPSHPARAFTLIEVMIALAIFFMAVFAILGLISQLLQNARAFQNKKAPPVSLVFAWKTSMTNRVTPGETTYEFSDISSDLGELYRDYNFSITFDPDLDMTNGLWDVTCQIFNRRTHQVESELSGYYWDPSTQARHVGEGRR